MKKGKKKSNEVRNEKRVKVSKVTGGKKEDSKWPRGKSNLTSAEKEREGGDETRREEVREEEENREKKKGEERRILVKEHRSNGREKICLVKWYLGCHDTMVRSLPPLHTQTH